MESTYVNSYRLNCYEIAGRKLRPAQKVGRKIPNLQKSRVKTIIFAKK